MRSWLSASFAKRLALHPVREVRRSWFRYRHARSEPHDIVCRRNGLALRLRSNSVLCESLYVGGGFEEAESKLLRRLAKPGMFAVDVGANVGLYSVLFGRVVGRSGHVWSFEPFSPTARYLRENVELNALDNVTVIEKALADKEGVLDFHVFPEGCDVYNSLGAVDRPAEEIQAIRTIRVPVTTLDIYADEAGIQKVDLLKIDVEGAEECVLRGAARLINRSPDVQILAETYEPSAKQCGCSSKRLIEMLAGWGFALFEIGTGGCPKPCVGRDFAGIYAFFKRV
jgi:FkbM family methyltransferase